MEDVMLKTKTMLLAIISLMLGLSSAHAKKKCDCYWLKDPTLNDFRPGINLVVTHYKVKEWNEFTIKDRLPECISTCKQHLTSNSSLVFNKICSNNTLYPVLPANSTSKYRLGVKAAVDRPMLNLNFQTGGYSYSNYVNKKQGQPCSY